MPSDEKVDSDQAVFWVKIPVLLASSTTEFYVYYGTSGVSVTTSDESILISGEVEAYADKTKNTWGHSQSNPDDTYNTYYHDSRNEIIYSPEAFETEGYLPVKISKIYFELNEQPGMDLSNYRIRYQLTSSSVVGSSFTTDDWTLVYGPSTIRPSGVTWWEHDVADFYWTENNLLLDLSRDNDTWIGGGGMMRRTSIGSNKMLSYYSDSLRDWPFDGSGTERDYLPVTKFEGLLRKYVSPEPEHTSWG
jgi:hypothetical protein